jgi:ATP phosphoribosyltransferase
MAIPSKGRLKEQTEAYLADANLPISMLGGARGYRARMTGAPGVDVVLMSASEIAAALVDGDIHAGVSGEDLLHETAAGVPGRLHLLMPLGFGHARLVVAVPQSWIDVNSMADLEDVSARFEARTGSRMRVATKYVRQTRRFFAEHGVGRYRIVESAGATEGAPASGAAELIVDITTTGATLAGNGLKVLRDGLILSSEAQLAVSLQANWTEAALGELRAVSDILAARTEGRSSRTLLFSPQFDVACLGAELAVPVSELRPGEAVCARADAHALARAITVAGGGPVRAQDADFVYRSENPRFAALLMALQAAGTAS